MSPYNSVPMSKMILYLSKLSVLYPSVPMPRHTKQGFKMSPCNRVPMSKNVFVVFNAYLTNFGTSQTSILRLLYNLKFKNENMMSTTMVDKKDCVPNLWECIKICCGEIFLV